MTRFRLGILLLWLLNLIDAVSTHVALKLGIAYEVNPLIREAFNISPALAWLLKFSLLYVGTVILTRHQADRRIRLTLAGLNGLYVAVLIAHAYVWYMFYSL